MCGIAGRVNVTRDRAVSSRQLIEAMRRIAHRGPDGQGIHLQDNVGLGHRRLAIIDLATGAQPMCNEDRSIWVTYNGEIYNYLLLREELKSKGHQFATRSDTEVLVHGYEEWGDELPAKLRGMFAFALWDSRQRRLLLVRDRLGIKPLYWTLAGGDLVFGSEIKSLFAFDDVYCALNSGRIADYFALRYVPGPQTLFAGIYRLQPGHTLVYQDGGATTISPFWDVPIDPESAPDSSKLDVIEESEALTQELLESVRMRLMSEVPVGVFLSGGIDSTAVAWAMKQAEPRALKSFAVGYEDDSEGELAWARLAAQELGTEHREVVVDSATFLNSLQPLAWHLDEPLSDGACIPLMHLAKRAREEVVVVLSGEGADEILAGYPIYSKMLALERLRAWGKNSLDSLLALVTRRSWHHKVDRYLNLARLPLEKRYFGVGRGFDDALISKYFGPRTMDDLAQRYQPYWQHTARAPALHRLLYVDTKVWLPDDLLIKADKMTMAWSIELRVPFLDHELLASAWSLPPELKLHHKINKHLLKISMAGKIPRPIIHRKKKGFPVPLSRWLKTSLYEPCRETLLASRSAARSIFGANAICSLLDEHRNGRADRREELFSLWVFEEWNRAFFGAKTAPVAEPAQQIKGEENHDAQQPVAATDG